MELKQSIKDMLRAKRGDPKYLIYIVSDYMFNFPL